MTIKQMRMAVGLSQSELAAISGINLRSLQDYEQGHKKLSSAKAETLYRLSLALGCSTDELYSMCCPSIDYVHFDRERVLARLSAYERCLEKRRSAEVHFPIIVEDEKVDMSRIYPTKQAYVKGVLNELRGDGRVSSLFLFGSSITMSCNKDSDIDFAVGLSDYSKEATNEISEKIQIACDWNADIIWMGRLSDEEPLYKNIMKGFELL